MKPCADTSVLLSVCVLIVAACAGCLVPSTSPGTHAGTGMATPASGSADEAFLSLYEHSQADIATRMEVMNRLFPVGTAMRNAPYLPSELWLSAQELEKAADAYHASMIKIEPFGRKENELQRNDYLKYLHSVRKLGADVAAASEAEMNGDYALAQNYAESARDALKSPEGVPGDVHNNVLREISVSLDDYIQKMRERRV